MLSSINLASDTRVLKMVTTIMFGKIGCVCVGGGWLVELNQNSKKNEIGINRGHSRDLSYKGKEYMRVLSRAV